MNNNRPLRTAPRTEGLDDRGEAPPPYAPGDKPPSISTIDTEDDVRIGSSRSVNRRASNDNEMEDVELGDISRPRPFEPPPGYHVPSHSGSRSGVTPAPATGDIDDAGITRPETAITTDDVRDPDRTGLNRTHESPQA